MIATPLTTNNYTNIVPKLVYLLSIRPSKCLFLSIFKPFVLLLVLTSCAEQGKITLTSDATVVAFGDSLTVGVGGAGINYPSELSKLLGVEVINQGVSGELTYQGLTRLKTVMDTYVPDLVILLHGGNDILYKIPDKGIQENLEKMIKLVQKNKAKVLLIGVPKFSFFLKPANFYQQLATQYGVVYLPNILPTLLQDYTFKHDNIHLNNKGYKKLAKQISNHIIFKKWYDFF